MDRNHAETTASQMNQNSGNVSGNIKEAVCINAARVYDSCSS